jgi:tetratricopeptide (TPR) repeat protein
MGVSDTIKQVHDFSLDLLLYTLGKNRSTKEDSLKFINDMKDLYAQYPESEKVYSYLCDALILNNDEAAVVEIGKNHLAKYPDSVLPHIYSAFLLQNQKKYQEAIDQWNKVPESQPNYVQFAYYRAVCKYNIAVEFNEANSDARTGRLTPENETKFKELIAAAQADFEKCQELDPDQNTVKWKYLLHNVYTQLGLTDKAAALE